MKLKTNYNWIIKIVVIAFLISLLFSTVSESAIPNLNIYFSILLALFFIFIGVIFDMIGVAITTADIAVFNSMASKKRKGAKTAILLKKNADKVSTFCNDVIGDICGIISGSTGAVISINISNNFNTNQIITTIIVMSIISSITIGGKAIEKTYAINNGNKIIYRFACIISLFRKDR